MILETLTIALKSKYSKPSADNRYEACLSVAYNDNRMQVKLSNECCQRILELAADEIAAAAQVQISDFVRTAIAIAKTPMIEGKLDA